MDKDTWIAEKIFPKSTNTVRKPKNNVRAISVETSIRKTKITLCVMGCWAIYFPPYNLARLGSLTRAAGYKTRVYDFNIESYYDLREANPELVNAWNNANYYWWQNDYPTQVHPTYEPFLNSYIDTLLADEPDIIGFTTYYTNIQPTHWVINEIKRRRPGITILVGGSEASERYYKKPSQVDYCFVGESEQNFLEFLNNWENGIQPESPIIGSLYSDIRIDLDSLPYPDYSDFDLSIYLGKNSVCSEISRGCIAKCSYCTETLIWKYRDRSAHNIIDELEYQAKQYGIIFVSFVDSLMNGNLKEFRKFCEGLIERKIGISWWGYIRNDGRMDLEFYKLMRMAGAQGFNYGIESGSDKVLTAINKKVTVSEINENIINSHAVGMKVAACWVIGAPGEDIEALTHSFNMLWNHRNRIIACSPGPGLGDNVGSDYDNREKYNLNPRSYPWLGGWYTLDMKNTHLHRQIRIKLMHIWLYLCNQSGGTIQNVHSVGNITDHFSVKFNSEYINDQVEYENFDFDIIKSGLGDFADSSMNEVFGLFRMLWRARGGFEITINFNPELDHRDFAGTIVKDTNTYISTHYFKIDDEGNYITKNSYSLINNYRDVIDTSGYDYTYEASGKWNESTKTRLKKIIYLDSQPKEILIPMNTFPIEGCFASMSGEERTNLHRFSKKLADNSVVIEVGSLLGGGAAIMAHSNKNIQIHCIESFNGSLIEIFNNIQPWIEDQIIDTCIKQGVANEEGINLVRQLSKNFEDDPSGYLAWKKVTEKYTNITLHRTNRIAGWDAMVDLCFINTRYNPGLHNNLDFWAKYVKTGGFIMVHNYNDLSSPDVNSEVNAMLVRDWKLIGITESLVLIQKN